MADLSNTDIFGELKVSLKSKLNGGLESIGTSIFKTNVADTTIRKIEIMNESMTSWNGSANSITNWGLKWAYTDSQRRAYIMYDHNAREEFTIASGYGDIVFNVGSGTSRIGDSASPHDLTERFRITLNGISTNGDVTANAFRTANAQGIYIGDDAKIFYIGNANTIGIHGQQNPAEGYIVFGNADVTSKLGRSGSGELTYAGNRVLTHGYFVSSNTNNAISLDVNINSIGYVTGISLFGQGDGALHTQAHSSSWQHQIYGDYRTGQLAIRGKNANTWQAWRTVLDSSNFNSYAPTLTGGGASGTWAISISGNAATVGGLAVHSTTNNEANRIVRTDGNGYIQAGWINTTSGDHGATAISRIYVSNDAYIRYVSPAQLISTLALVTTSDSRLTNSRTPVAHTHAISDVTSLQTALDSKASLAGSSTQTFSTANLSVTGSISATGDITAFASDERLKTEFVKIENSLELTKQLDTGYYYFNDLAASFGFDSTKRQVGVKAGQLEKLLPEVVAPAPFDSGENGSLSGEHYLTVKYEKLTALLIQNIKELIERIEFLENKI